MSLTDSYDENFLINEEEIWNDLTIISNKKKDYEDVFYKLYFKCNDIKFWFETTFKDTILNFYKKYKLELYFSLILFIVFMFYLILWSLM